MPSPLALSLSLLLTACGSPRGGLPDAASARLVRPALPHDAISERCDDGQRRVVVSVLGRPAEPAEGCPEGPSLVTLAADVGVRELSAGALGR